MYIELKAKFLNLQDINWEACINSYKNRGKAMVQESVDGQTLNFTADAGNELTDHADSQIAR